MRITQKMFKSLNKNDQTELTIKSKEIVSKIKPLRFFTTFVWWTICTFAFSMIVLPLWKLAFGAQIFIVISRFFQSIIQIMFFFVIVGLITDFLVVLITLYKLEQLKKEYFDIQTKIKIRRK